MQLGSPVEAAAETLKAPLQAPLQTPLTVPLIREELRLIPAAHNHDGSPAWMIQDPIRNKFYRISWLDFEMLSRWHLMEIKAIVEEVNNHTALHIDESQVLDLIGFLQQHHLVQISSPEAVNSLIKEINLHKPSVLNWLIHHYLFFRIPIIRPQRLLAGLLPFVRWVYSPVTALVVLAITLAGLFLVARQWDTFRNTFVDQLTLAGLLSYSLALIFSKFLHELGHAFTATRYGVRVAHMGIAVLVMFPMPYTDTSESWKLSKPRQRLHIAAAGIITELALAGLATLAWSLAADGALRSALFFLATTSWVLTLAVNLSPFMRFDGYFILSDFLDFPNLHERSGALARTWMRRIVLGFEEAWPEEFPSSKTRALIAFAIITWFYRLTVFLGIAWLVYYFFFKVLGIILFLVEILWFVVLPIWRELKVWHKRRSEIKPNRMLLGLGLTGGLIVLGLIPWQTSVHAIGWIHATNQTIIYTPTSGKLVAYHAQGHVQKGDALFQLTSPDIAIDALRSQAMSDAITTEMRGLSGQEDGESRRMQLQYQQEKFNAEVKLYKDELSRMDIMAPFDGVLYDVDDNLAVGTWIQPKQALAVLIDPQSWAVDVFVEEADIARIKLHDKARIYLQQSYLKQLDGKVTQIDTARLQTLPNIMLDARYGGPIATLPGDKLVPQQSLYKVRVMFEQQPDLQNMLLARVSIQTEAKAWIPTAYRHLAALFIRESSF